MDRNETTRGYDDTETLRRMSAGIFSREFGSVDEAAKAVLKEDGGSNVDRLRRKYREQNWHERGLSEYVEAEIARRGLVRKPRHVELYERLKSAFDVFGRSHSKMSIRDIDRRVRDTLAPRGSVVIAMVVATLASLAVFHGAVSSEHSLVALLACSFFGLVFWANKTSETADHATATRHTGIVAAVTAALVVGLAYVAPTPGYLLGSLSGTVALAVGLTVIGTYVTSHISVTTRRKGQRRTFVVSALIWAIAVLSQAGTALMVTDTISARAIAEVSSIALN